jgi:putative transposase
VVFFQVPLRKEDRHKTAFRVQNTFYERAGMPMELQNSSAIFQRLMDHVLKEDIGERSFLYFDDILGFSKTEEKHKEDVERVLRKLVEAGLKGNKAKCIFMEKQMEFLGHILSKNIIIPLPKNTKGVEEYEMPRNVEETRRFLRLVNYYRKFIPSCASICSPLTEILKKTTKFRWEKEQIRAFDELK